MYSSKFAVALKVNGRVLREDGDTVRLPFGSEFSVFVKNMNSVRALVRIEIDGTDIAEGTSFIVPANDSIEIERFVKNRNMSAGLKFKFIERTAAIENGPRGIKTEDGLIRVEYEFEREPAPVKSYVPSYNKLRSRSRDSFTKSAPQEFWNSVGSTDTFGSSAMYSANAASTASFADSTTVTTASAASFSDKGITVGGSVSNQSFTTAAWFPTDGVKHVMVLRMLGQIGEVAVSKPLLVSTKIVCPTCGKKNKSNAKFCAECGTGLIDI